MNKYKKSDKIVPIGGVEMNKKISFLLIIILIIGTTVACGGDNTETIESEDGETEVTYTEDMKDSVDIPDEYPEDILPVYQGSFISAASKNNNGEYVIIAFSNDDSSEVKAYYEDILENTNVIMEQNAEGQYMKMGTKEGITYTVTIAPFDENEDYKTNINLVVMPEMDTGLETEEDPVEESDTDSDSYEIGENIDFPEDFPKDIPIYTESETKVLYSGIVEGNSSIGYGTKDDVKTVTDFYKNKLENSEEFMVQSFGENTIIIVKDGDLDFDVTITENSPDKQVDLNYTTLVQINYR